MYVLIIVPPGPVTNLVAISIGEREVSLSWLIGFNGYTPITDIEVDVIPAEGAPFRRVLGYVNTTTITNLMPFREYKFSVAVVNLAGRSELVNISARTLSLSMTCVVVHTTYTFHFVINYPCLATYIQRNTSA